MITDTYVPMYVGSYHDFLKFMFFQLQAAAEVDVQWPWNLAVTTFLPEWTGCQIFSEIGRQENSSVAFRFKVPVVRAGRDNFNFAKLIVPAGTVVVLYLDLTLVFARECGNPEKRVIPSQKA